MAEAACVHGQYFQFSQYNFTSQRINPAMTGGTRFASLDILSRTQKTGGDYNINSNFISLSYPLLHPSTGDPWSGIGMSILDDRSSGIFRRLEASLSYAVHLKINRYQQLSFGARALYQSSRISIDGLTTGLQYVPDHGFNSGYATGENFEDARSHYTTFSAGAWWQQVDRKGNVTGYWGLSLFDVNTPQFSYFGRASTLAATIVFAAGVQAYHKNELAIIPELLYTRNATTNVLNAGARFRYTLKSMPNQPPDKIDIITKYVVGRSAIAGVQLHREYFSFGISYDFPFIRSNVGNLGALEIGLSFRMLVESKKLKENRRKLEERQKNIARNKSSKKTTPVSTTPDSTVVVVVPTPEVEITRPDTTGGNTRAKAGRLSQEPLVVEKITLHFQFDYNSTDIDDETEAFLFQLSTTLREDPTLKLKIVGHTDNIGPEKFNTRLSQKRAEAVRDFLIHQGIPPDRLESSGKGMSEPVDTNDTVEGQSRNRRVEILLYK
jgi:type IX secretion system PorP/SprF family membrane protein